MKGSRRVVLCAIALVGVYAALLSTIRFHLCLNDFWAWSFLAAHSDLGQPASLQNGFMPPAYVLFLKALGPSREIAGAFVLGLVCVFLTALAVAAMARRVTASGVLAVILLALWPPFFQSGLTAGPDIVVAALVAGAVFLHWREDPKPGLSLLAGAFVGLGLLVRSHALVAGAGLVIAPVLVDRRLGRPALAMATGICGGLFLQVTLNLAADVPAWSTGQAFNVYKMMHGMDWYAPVRPDSIDVFELIAADPGRFLREWAGAFRRAGQWLLLPLLAAIWARRAARPGLLRLALLSLLAGGLYSVAVSLGDSPRAPVLMAAMVVAPTAGLVAAIRSRGLSASGLLVAAALAFAAVAAGRADREFFVHNQAQSRDFAQVEHLLLDAGAARASEVFTDDFDLYFRTLEGRRPLTRGGWGLIGIQGWEDEFPQLPTADPEQFLAACRARGVRFLALTKKSRRLGSHFPILRYDPAAAGAQPLGECGEFSVIAVETSPDSKSP